MIAAAHRTLLVDDHAVVRTGYALYLESDRHFTVVGEAGTAAEAYAQYQSLRPDIVIMDVMLPGASGVEASRRILAFDPAARILLFSMYAQPPLVRQALEMGVLGVLTKDSAPETLCTAAATVALGNQYLGQSLRRSVQTAAEGNAETRFDALTVREFEICQLLLGGASVLEMAGILSLSAKTVANRLTSVRQKLGVASDIELVKVAAAAGLVPWLGQPGIGARPGPPRRAAVRNPSRGLRQCSARSGNTRKPKATLGDFPLRIGWLASYRRH